MPLLSARRIALAAATLTTAGLTVLATPTTAEPAPASQASAWPTADASQPPHHMRTASATVAPTYSGTGWKALTSRGIYSIHPDPYTIVFATTTARTKLTPYLTGPARQITAITGIPVTVTTTIDTTPTTACPARHRIVVRYEYRPTGTAGMSTALPCASTVDQSAWGGHLRINSEYWAPGWYSSDPVKQDIMRKNVISHELGHIFGLAHPNYDRDRDGRVENYECVKNSAGWTPTLCSPNGGYRTASGAGKFVTEFDAVGLRQMARNWHLRRG